MTTSLLRQTFAMKLRLHIFIFIAEVSTAVDNLAAVQFGVAAARSKLSQHYNVALEAPNSVVSKESLISLREHSSLSASVIELGSRQLSAAWAILLGLIEAPPSIGEKRTASISPE